MNRVLILGSGIGMYGYLPAFHELGYEVFTLSRYEEKIKKRNELHLLAINYINSLETVPEDVQEVVVARTPQLQMEFLEQYESNFKRIYLEKPIALNLDDNRKALRKIQEIESQISIAYLFRYTEWFTNIIELVNFGSVRQVQIEWSLQRNLEGWKSEPAENAIFNSYGVHFFDLIRELGVDVTQTLITQNSLICKGNSEKIESFELCIKINQLVDIFRIVLKDSFEENNYNLEMSDPLGERNFFPRDYRIPLFKKYILDNREKSHYISIEKAILDYRSNGNIDV